METPMARHNGSIPLRLKIGTLQWYTPGSSIYDSWTYIHAKTKSNLPVQVLYEGGNGLWSIADLALVANYNNFYLFGAWLRPPFGRFCLKQGTNYDNNGGADYRNGTMHGCVGGNVILSKAIAGQTWWGSPTGGSDLYSYLEGEIYAMNLGYEKRVGIVYSYDNWASGARICLAHYNGNAREGSGASYVSGVERWTFRTPDVLDGQVQNYRFAVFYEDAYNNTTWWDNNFQQDYLIEKNSGTTLA